MDTAEISSTASQSSHRQRRYRGTRGGRRVQERRFRASFWPHQSQPSAVLFRSVPRDVAIQASRAIAQIASTAVKSIERCTLAAQIQKRPVTTTADTSEWWPRGAPPTAATPAQPCRPARPPRRPPVSTPAQQPASEPPCARPAASPHVQPCGPTMQPMGPTVQSHPFYVCPLAHISIGTVTERKLCGSR